MHKKEKIAILDGKLLQIEGRIKELKSIKKKITIFKSEIENEEC